MARLCPCLLGLFLVGACAPPALDEDTDASDSNVELASQVVVLDRSAAANLVVGPDRLTLPALGHERYVDLPRGTVVVTARAGLASQNPDGALRRVEDVHVENGQIVVKTQPAALTDAVVRGSLRTSSGGATFDDHGADPLAISPQSTTSFDGIALAFENQTLFSNVDEVEGPNGKVHLTESVEILHATLQAKPTVDLDLAIADGYVSRFTAKIEGNLDVTVQARALTSLDGEIDDAARDALLAKRHEIRHVVYQSNPLPLPTVSIGSVPVSPSIQFTVALRCELAFGGALDAVAGIDARQYVRLAASFKDHAWQPPLKSDFEVRPDFSMTRGAPAKVKCAVEAEAELVAYGVGGVTMSVAPYVTFDVTTDDAGSAYRVGAGAEGSMRGRADTLGVKPEELTRPLVHWTPATLLEGRAP